MVTLIGEGITVDELAHHFGTIGYEVLTSLGRVTRGSTRARLLTVSRALGPLLFHLRVENLFAGIAERIVLFIETRNDAATAGRDSRTIFFIIGLARGPLLGGQVLCESSG